jgi:NTE family protein
MLLVADADQPPVLHATETAFLVQRAGRAEAAEVLVLLHPADRRCPHGTRAWLARRPVADHVHVRPALERDMARLARIQSRTAVGLVLAGGGARGLAHLGVAQALQQQGIEFDFVGGTSIGSVMAVLLASDRPLDEVVAVARRGFAHNPTGDYNWLPLISLIRGRRLRRIVETGRVELLGHPGGIEDLWKNCYCVASNYSQAREQVLTQGDAVKAMLASAAIPGALPPVLLDGDLLCDGGTFNNFPVDVMRRQRGVGHVIGVDLSFRKPRRIEHEHVPDAWELLRDRLRTKPRRKYRCPSLTSYLMNVTVLYSTSRQRQSKRLTDLHFNPPLERVGMLQWDKFDGIVAQGREHALQVLDAMAPQALSPYQAAAR